jgi:hypothetical protein
VNYAKVSKECNKKRICQNVSDGVALQKTNSIASHFSNILLGNEVSCRHHWANHQKPRKANEQNCLLMCTATLHHRADRCDIYCVQPQMKEACSDALEKTATPKVTAVSTMTQSMCKMFLNKTENPSSPYPRAF